MNSKEEVFVDSSVEEEIMKNEVASSLEEEIQSQHKQGHIISSSTGASIEEKVMKLKKRPIKI